MPFGGPQGSVGRRIRGTKAESSGKGYGTLTRSPRGLIFLHYSSCYIQSAFEITGLWKMHRNFRNDPHSGAPLKSLVTGPGHCATGGGAHRSLRAAASGGTTPGSSLRGFRKHSQTHLKSTFSNSIIPAVPEMILKLWDFRSVRKLST